MIEISFENFKTLFRSCCIIIATLLIIYWIYVFIQNEDLCIVDYKRYYETENDVYPSLSLCFRNSFSEAKLKTINPLFNSSKYVKFLKGEHFDSEMLRINYSDIEVDINEKVVEEYMGYRNGTYISNYLTKDNKRIFNKTFTGFCFDNFHTCYTLQVPQEKEIQSYAISLKSNIFKNSIRPPNYDFMSLFHYPNQLLLSTKTVKYSWSERETYDNYELLFRVKGVEMLHRRNKKGQPCYLDWKNYDEALLENHVRKVGCRPPYLKNKDIDTPICNTTALMKKSKFILKTGDYDLDPPCTSMEKIYYGVEESTLKDSKWAIEDHFWIGIYLYNHRFKEILKTRYCVIIYWYDF